MATDNINGTLGTVERIEIDAEGVPVTIHFRPEGRDISQSPLLIKRKHVQVGLGGMGSATRNQFPVVPACAAPCTCACCTCTHAHAHALRVPALRAAKPLHLRSSVPPPRLCRACHSLPLTGSPSRSTACKGPRSRATSTCCSTRSSSQTVRRCDRFPRLLPIEALRHLPPIPCLLPALSRLHPHPTLPNPTPPSLSSPSPTPPRRHPCSARSRSACLRPARPCPAQPPPLAQPALAQPAPAHGYPRAAARPWATPSPPLTPTFTQPATAQRAPAQPPPSAPAHSASPRSRPHTPSYRSCPLQLP